MMLQSMLLQHVSPFHGEHFVLSSYVVAKLVFSLVTCILPIHLRQHILVAMWPQFPEPLL